MFLITGASSPLGVELAKNLLEDGESYLLVVRDKAEMGWVSNFDQSLVAIVESDLSNAENVAHLCSKILHLATNIQVFIHLAAISTEDQFDVNMLCHNFRVNVFSAWQIANTCISVMGAHGGGRILFVGSVGHKFGGKSHRPSYAASKYLLEYFPKMFRESASLNVLINTLRLGVMAKGTQSKSGVDADAFTKRVELIPTGAAVTHREAISNIRYLCSMDSKSVHNAVIACTGGE